MPEIKTKILPQISYFSIARYLAEAIFAARGFLLAKILGPAFFGIWIEMKIALMFLQYVRLGTNEGLLREYPYAVGRDDHALLDKIKHTVVCFNLLSAIVMAASILLIFSFFMKAWSSEVRYLWCGLLVIFFMNQLYWLLHLILQAEKRFFLLSKMVLGFAVMSTGVGLLFAYYHELAGFLFALILAYIFIIIYVIKGNISEFKPNWDATLSARLIKIGFPIMACGAFFILLLNIDKIVIWLMLSKEDLGIYAIQSYITNVIILIPGSVSMVLFPIVMERLGHTSSSLQIQQYLAQPTLVMGYLASPFLGLLFLMLHLPIKWLLPEYTLAIVPGQILILSSFFMVVSKMPSTILIALNKQNTLLAISALSVACGFLSDYLLIQSGMGITGVAYGTSLSFILYAVLTIIFSVFALQSSLKKLVGFLIKLFVPFICILLSIYLAISLIPENNTSWVSDIVQTNFQCFVYLLPICILLIFAKKRLNIFSSYAFDKRKNIV